MAYEDIDDLKPYYTIEVTKKGALRAYNGVWAVLYILWGLLFILMPNFIAWEFFWLIGVIIFTLFGPLRIVGFGTKARKKKRREEEDDDEEDDEAEITTDDLSKIIAQEVAKAMASQQPPATK